jgi:hypothetical protein
VRTGAKRCESPRQCAIAVELFEADYEIRGVSVSGIVLARLRLAHLLLSLPCALKMHEEDWKLDVRLKTKISGGGNRLFRIGRCVCSKEGRPPSKAAKYCGGYTKRRKASAEQQQSRRQETGRQEGKTLNACSPPITQTALDEGPAVRRI